MRGGWWDVGLIDLVFGHLYALVTSTFLTDQTEHLHERYLNLDEFRRPKPLFNRRRYNALEVTLIGLLN